MTQELCNLCGLCKSVCPIYKTTNKETYSPRGHIILVRENLLTDKLDYCLSCNLCQKVCPSNIDVSKIVRKSRTIKVNHLNENSNDKKLIQNLRETGNIYGI